MANSDTRSAWHQIQDGVRETERLITQKEYNLSMIKARQTLEVIIKQLSGQNNEGEQSLADIIDALYTDSIISKLSCEHYHKIRALGNKAVHENDNDAYSANVAYSLLSEEVQTFIRDYSPKRYKQNPLVSPIKIENAPRNRGNVRNKSTDSTKRSTKRSSSGRNKKKVTVNTSDLIKVVIGFAILLVLIALFRAINPLKKSQTAVNVTTTAADESENSSDVTTETVAESQAPTAYITTARLNVRSAPSRDGDILATLNTGVAVEYAGEYDSEWSIINYNGGQAYVATSYIQPAQ